MKAFVRSWSGGERVQGYVLPPDVECVERVDPDVLRVPPGRDAVHQWDGYHTYEFTSPRSRPRSVPADPRGVWWAIHNYFLETGNRQESLDLGVSP